MIRDSDAIIALLGIAAIMAERERCAQITEKLIEQRRGISLSFDMIAAAIRKQGEDA